MAYLIQAGRLVAAPRISFLKILAVVSLITVLTGVVGQNDWLVALGVASQGVYHGLQLTKKICHYLPPLTSMGMALAGAMFLLALANLYFWPLRLFEIGGQRYFESLMMVCQYGFLLGIAIVFVSSYRLKQ